MSKIYNFNEWYTKINEQNASEPTKGEKAEPIRFNTTVGGKKISYSVSINLDKETKKRYPGEIHILTEGENYRSHKSDGKYTWPKDMHGFRKTMGSMTPKSTDKMSVVGAWKKFIAIVRKAGYELNVAGDFGKFMNGEYVKTAGNIPGKIPTSYSQAEPFFTVDTASGYTFKVKKIKYIDVDTKKNTANELGRQIFCEKSGKKTTYLINTIYSRSFAALDRDKTSRMLKPMNPEQIAKLEKVMDKHTMDDTTVWKELGAGIKDKLGV